MMPLRKPSNEVRWVVWSELPGLDLVRVGCSFLHAMQSDLMWRNRKKKSAQHGEDTELHGFPGELCV